jgi:signal peptidase I
LNAASSSPAKPADNWNNPPSDSLEGFVERTIQNRGGCVMDTERMRQKNKSKAEFSLKAKAIKSFRELLLTFICVLAINSFVMASFEVPTGSMENTIKAGDFLFVNKFIYGGSTPYSIPLTSARIPHLRLPGFRGVERGDVIVFDWPGNRDQAGKPDQAYYLKRCIGLPGDIIRIDQRTLYVNNQKQELPLHGKYLRPQPMPAGYPNPDIFPRTSYFNEDNYGPITVPGKGSVLSLSADNFSAWEVFIRREGHSTSLINDQVFIDGRPVNRYVVERNYLFAMGDNRDNSLDSRFWGFVPIEDVIGTPMIVFWSWNPEISFSHPIDKLLSVRLGRIGSIIR